MRVFLLLFLAVSAFGQSLKSGIDNVIVDPSGACAYGAGPGYFGRLRYNILNGNLWGCEGGVWTLITGSAGGMFVISVSGANGLTGTVTSSGSISGIDAVADGSTKGVAAFTAADFNASAGLISLDYTNGQKATASVPGYLTAADWALFNAGGGSGGGGAPGVTQPPATWATAINNLTLVGGSFTLGTKVLFTAASGAMKGVKFGWKTGAGALTVKVTLWDLGTANTGGSSLGTATVAVNATGLYEADFGSPITLTQFHYYTVAFWENSGAQHTQDTIPEATPPSAFVAGSFVYVNLGLYAAGDGQPVNVTTDRYPVEAVLN